MPPVIIGNISVKANLDDDYRQLCRKAFEQIRQPSLQGTQRAPTKFAWLAVGESNQVGISNRQHTRRIPKVEALSKFGLGRVDCKQVVHGLSRVLHRDVYISSQAQF